MHRRRRNLSTWLTRFWLVSLNRRRFFVPFPCIREYAWFWEFRVKGCTGCRWQRPPSTRYRCWNINLMLRPPSHHLHWVWWLIYMLADITVQPAVAQHSWYDWQCKKLGSARWWKVLDQSIEFVTFYRFSIIERWFIGCERVKMGSKTSEKKRITRGRDCWVLVGRLSQPTTNSAARGVECLELQHWQFLAVVSSKVFESVTRKQTILPSFLLKVTFVCCGEQ